MHRPVTGAGHLGMRVAAVLAVIAVHLLVMHQVGQGMADFSASATMPPRVEVVYSRELEITAPPAVVAPLAAPVAMPAPRQAALAEPAASKPAKRKPAPKVTIPQQAASAALAAAEPESERVVAPEPIVAAPAAEPIEQHLLADLAAVAKAASAPPAASAPAAEPFEWPASTRITYKLTGNYRGEVLGDAQVEWVRVGAGERYQVHMDVTVGPSFAPIYSRRMSSEGQLTAAGLYPERYDEDSKVAFRDRRVAHMSFEAEQVVLKDGNRVDRLPGMQDSASQFVQMSYLFSRNPALLTPGRTVEMPLALPRRQSIWVYDVRNVEPVYTLFGEVEAVRLQPRREARKGDDLTAEVWFAPSLRYLPIRIRIRQDEETYLDLMIARRPQLAK
jgi:hypothetical protein